MNPDLEDRPAELIDKKSKWAVFILLLPAIIALVAVAIWGLV